MRQKNKIIYVFLLLFSSFFLYGEKMILDTGISEKTVNLVEKIQREQINNVRLKFFFEAIKRQNNKFVANNLATKENIEKRNMEGKNPDLPENAVVYGPAYSDIMKIIEEKGGQMELIDVNSRDSEGFSPIIIAIQYKNNEILKLLIENGANIYEEHPVFDRLTLHTACYYENEEAVKILLEADPKLVNARSGNDGWTPLHDAVLKSNSRIVKILLENGANPMMGNNKGGTPMDMATEFGKGEIVKLLRDNVKKNRR